MYYFSSPLAKQGDFKEHPDGIKSKSKSVAKACEVDDPAASIVPGLE
jgi:hypothetical protein